MTLLAAYNFDEASGNVLDVTGNGHDFAISGNTVRTASGHTNGGLTQTATATAAGPSPTGLQGTSRTWMTWIKFTAAVSGWILEFHVSSANTGAWGLLDISGTLRFRAKDSSNNVYESTAINRNLGTWQHIAATHDGANLKLYINGVLQSTTPMATAVWTADVLNVLDQTGSNVIIDDTRFYDAALDAATITSLMNTPVSGSSSFTGSVALSGSGALTAAGKPAVAGPLALTGSGAVSGIGTPQAAGTAVLTGSGGLTGAGMPALGGPLALAGAGAISGSGAPSLAGAVAFSGAGAAVAAGTPSALGSLALSGAGSLAGTGDQTRADTIPLSGGSALALTGAPGFLGEFALGGTGALALTGQPAIHALLALGGVGTLILTAPSTGEPAHEPMLTATNAPSSHLVATNAPTSRLEAHHGV